jgi:hypothetical protein
MLLLNHAQWLIDILNKAYRENFTGNIQINFYLGGVTNITKTESIKPKE